MTNPRIAPTAGHGTAAKTSHALEDPFPTPLGPVAADHGENIYLGYPTASPALTLEAPKTPLEEAISDLGEVLHA